MLVEMKNHYGEGTHETETYDDGGAIYSVVSGDLVKYRSGAWVESYVRTIFNPKIGDDYLPKNEGDYPTGTLVLVYGPCSEPRIYPKFPEVWLRTELRNGAKTETPSLATGYDETATVVAL